MRILVVEDERDLNHLIKKNLKAEGYGVDSAYDGLEALDYLESAEYDLIIADIMMPNMNGIDLVREIRHRNIGISVIFLTAKDAVEDRVTGLDAGADDYLIKPFAFAELLARIRVLFRKGQDVKDNKLCVANLSLNLETREVKRGEEPISLSAKEFNLLRYMMLNQGIVLSRDKLEEHIGDWDHTTSSNVIDVYIRYLRKKIDDKYDKKLIQTVRGVGYTIKS